MSSDPPPPSLRSPNLLISPSTLDVNETEKHRRIHFTDEHNSTPTKLARTCFPVPVLLDSQVYDPDMTTTQHYRLLLQQFQGYLHTLFGIHTNHCSTRKQSHFDPRLLESDIPRLTLAPRRTLILWCATCEGNSLFSPICHLQLTQEPKSSGKPYPSLIVHSLFYHQCTDPRLPTGQILSKEGFVMSPLDYQLIVGNLFNDVLKELENYSPPTPAASPILTPEEQRLLQLRIKQSKGDTNSILQAESIPSSHWQPPMERTDLDISHHFSNIYHRTSGCLLAPFHPKEFHFDVQHYLSFIGRFGIYLSSTLGITNDFSPFHFDITSYIKDSTPSSPSNSNLSQYYIPNPDHHLSFRGLRLLLGGDELIAYSPWRTYGEGFHADVAPSNILRMIPHMNERMVPFTTIIPLGYHPNEYTLDDLPHRILNINHPHHQVKIVFGNILLITGDTIHQDTTNTGNERGLHPTLTASIFSSKVDSYLAENKLSNCPIDPIELTPLNTMYMPIHQIKDFILYQKRQVLDFLKCAIPHLDHLRIHAENPDNLQTSAEFRECYDFLHHSHEYLFPFELSLSREYFTGLIATSPSTISQDPHFNNPFPPYQQFVDIELISSPAHLTTIDPVLSNGRVPFPDSGTPTYIRGMQKEELIDSDFLHCFSRPNISWELFDVSGNGNCGYYVHQCHLELHKMFPPMTCTHFRKDLYQFAQSEFDKMTSPNQWWTYFGYKKDSKTPKRIERLTSNMDTKNEEIKYRLIGRDNFDNGCSRGQHMSNWENSLLVHRFKYDVITYDVDSKLFTHLHLEPHTTITTSWYSIAYDFNKIPTWSTRILTKLSHNPKSVLFRRYIQLNSSLGNEQIGHFQWLKPVFQASGSLEPSPQQLQSPTTLKRTPSDMIF